MWITMVIGYLQWKKGYEFLLTVLLLLKFLNFIHVFLEGLDWFRCSFMGICEALFDIACKKDIQIQIGRASCRERV